MKVTVILRAAIYVVGLAMLAICFVLLPELAREQSVENPGAVTLPYIIGAYIIAIPIFVALYQTLRLASYLDEGNAFTQQFVQTLRNIKICTVVFGALVVLGAAISIYVARSNNPSEDVTHIVALAIIFTFASSVIATAVALFQRLFQSATDIKTENDLIV